MRSLSWAAAELGIGTPTARSLAERGQLPGAFKLGPKLWRVSVVRFRADIEALAEIEARAAKARHPAGKGLRPADPEPPGRAPLSIVADAPEGNAFLTGISSKDSIPVVPVDSGDNSRRVAQTRLPSRKRAQTRSGDRKQSTVSTRRKGDNS